MRCLLTGYWLTLIHVSVAPNDGPRLSQRPRFCGVTSGRSVRMCCRSSAQRLPGPARWYKVGAYDDAPERRREVEAGGRILTRTTNQTSSGCLYIQSARAADRGVYFCEINGTWGPGTELQVARPLSHAKALQRTKMKDGLILAQGLLLAVCVAAVLLRRRTLSEKMDAIYEEPEDDHIYEGLPTETCGDGEYEDLSVYAEPDGAEAPWE